MILLIINPSIRIRKNVAKPCITESKEIKNLYKRTFSFKLLSINT